MACVFIYFKEFVVCLLIGLVQQIALRGGKSRNLFFNRKGIAGDKKSPAFRIVKGGALNA
jgi:hypothetical protein